MFKLLVSNAYTVQKQYPKIYNNVNIYQNPEDERKCPYASLRWKQLLKHKKWQQR